MNIVRADLGHLDAVAALFDQYRQFYEQPPALDECRAFMESRLAKQESIVFAAQADNGSLLGFTQLYRSWCSVALQEIVYLYDLFVAPGARRRGTGRALMNAARAYAESIGAGRLQLETAIDNLPGQALYESLGWERDEEFYTYHLELDRMGGSQ